MSASTSMENLGSDVQIDGGSMCLELALEGERLFKAGDCRAAVAFFQAAVKAGADDLRTLTALYSRLGNAYLYLGDYKKAMQYHKHDITLAKKLGDKLGLAKATGNLGNTLKVMRNFTEAIQCCKRHLDISKELRDVLIEGRALYNMGNIYHEQGKQLRKWGKNDPGYCSQDVRECLTQAISFYEQYLYLVRSLDDKEACGRVCGNLGNTYYLLGEFNKAIKYHTERLQIAQEFGDRAAERRANSNLGNSHIFLGQFEKAAEHYIRTLILAEKLGDSAFEAQVCYSLGNTYTLLSDYRNAELYHVRYLEATIKLQDRSGECRACWSLSNTYVALSNHEKALYYAMEHYKISKELGDNISVSTAQMNINNIRKILGLAQTDSETSLPLEEDMSIQTLFNALRVRRETMDQPFLLQITPDAKKKDQLNEVAANMTQTDSNENPADSFFDLLSQYQSERMTNQRDMFNISKLQKSNNCGKTHISNRSQAMIQVITLKSQIMDSQGTELRLMPSQNKPKQEREEGLLDEVVDLSFTEEGVTAKPEDEFLEIIVRVQGSRIEDQRTELPVLPRATTLDPITDPVPFTMQPAPNAEKCENLPKLKKGNQVPDDDFLNMLMKAQSYRMEDQRASLPIEKNRQNLKDGIPKK